MRGVLRTVGIVALTALLTSAFWLTLYALREDNVSVPEAEVAAPAVTPAEGLLIPVAGVTAAQLVDTFTQARDGGARPHDAIDIMAPRGTAVVAVADGVVAKLFGSRAGGTTLYQYDPGGRLTYYYAHLDRYADGIAEGQRLRRGQVLGYVGSTGNADPAAPHLHFAVLERVPGGNWSQGRALNPYPMLGGR
jgi:murein DD-endopeptidase MepM/ murein hydrolase activator NlpD